MERTRLTGAMKDDFRGESVVLAESNADSVNWITAGGVNPVKDQGQCGSCWAFSAVGALEGAHFISSGKLLSFSEQQLVDCAICFPYKNYGCGGGWSYKGMKYWEHYNAEIESVYTYTAENNDCQYNALKASDVAVSAYSAVTPNNAAQMKAAVTQQPVSVSIEADKAAFQQYKSGVFDNAAGCGTQTDHATLVVGFGSEDGTDYWIMRNSWGAAWGEAGYMRLAIIDGVGVCAIQSAPYWPTSN